MGRIHRGRDRRSRRASLFGVIAILWFMGVFALGCAGSQLTLPPVSDGSSSVRHVGKFVWFDLFTRDLPVACDFYGRLFGWEFKNTMPGDAHIKTVYNGGVPIGNAVQIKADQGRLADSRWLGFMSVADLDQAVRVVSENGGTIRALPKEIPHRGYLAVVRDPEGAPFGILTAAKGDPPDGPYVPNVWIGSELWTSHVDRALKFYRQLVGYEPQFKNVGVDSRYLLLMKDGRPRGGMVKIPWKGVKPNWVPYVGVKDIEAIVATAEKLGGRVLVGLDPDRTDDVAILADPAGAVFGVQQLPAKVANRRNPS